MLIYNTELRISRMIGIRAKTLNDNGDTEGGGGVQGKCLT